MNSQEFQKHVQARPNNRKERGAGHTNPQLASHEDTGNCWLQGKGEQSSLRAYVASGKLTTPQQKIQEVQTGLEGLQNNNKIFGWEEKGVVN